jgi:hypothetical protein
MSGLALDRLTDAKYFCQTIAVAVRRPGAALIKTRISLKAA